MEFLIRNIEWKDAPSLLRLARQSSLLHLPPDERILADKIARSIRSFSSPCRPEDGEYVFVMENTSKEGVIGTSLVLADYGGEDCPYYCLRVSRRGGLIHPDARGEFLQLCRIPHSISAVGGLVLDRPYRGLKLGRMISLIRFVYIRMHADRFSEFILAELMSPFEGMDVNPFWEQIGRRFCGFSFPEARRMAETGERHLIWERFTRDLVDVHTVNPELCPHHGWVIPGSGEAEQHLLEKIGLRYLQSVDPLDGGLIYGSTIQGIKIVAEGAYYRARAGDQPAPDSLAFVGVSRDNGFRGGQYPVRLEADEAVMPASLLERLEIKEGDQIYVSRV